MTLIAQDVPFRVIVEEWQRVSGVTFVNADQLDNESVTLDLTDVTERTAIATLLRKAVGYVVVQRPDSGTVGRVVILPRRSASPIAGSSPSESVATAIVDAPVTLGRQRVPGVFSPGDPPEWGGPSPMPKPADVPVTPPTQEAGVASTIKTTSTSPGSSRPGEITTAPPAPQPTTQPQQIFRPSDLPSPSMRRPVEQ